MDKLDTAFFSEDYELMLEQVICNDPELLYIDSLLCEIFAK